MSQRIDKTRRQIERQLRLLLIYNITEDSQNSLVIRTRHIWGKGFSEIYKIIY
jgi:hypothetical protein